MNIHEDIVDDILSWLPVKSLLRFKLVCKDWFVKIQSDSFIAIHNKNQTTKEKFLLHQSHYYIKKFNVVSICSKEDAVEDDTQILFHQSSIQQYNIEDMPLDDDFLNYGSLQIIGTYNGLVCLAYFEWGDPSMIILWNPATREFKNLPPFQLPPSHRPGGPKQVGDHVGFGFDCTTNDYKVIQFLQFQKRNSEGYINVMKIYSLSANCWKEYDCSDLSTKINVQGNVNYLAGSHLSDRGRSIFWNGKLYWLAVDTTSIGKLILSFDMGKEVFQTIPSPSAMELVKSNYKLRIDLFPLRDSIAIVLYDSCICEIWTLKDLEQGCSSWIKMSNIDTTSKISWALGFWNRRGNEHLFLYDGSLATVDCNKSKNCMKKIIVKNGIGSLPFSVFTYVETLVSVNRS